MARPTFEACATFVIPISSIKAVMNPSASVICFMTFPAEGKPFSIRARVETLSAPFVELSHAERWSDGQPVQYRVDLISTPQPFGGVRWWFQCPRTGQRSTKLVLPRGGDRFASPGSWDLGYATQRAGRLELASRRAGRVYRSIGGKGNWRDGPPDKPRWMRWRTYSEGVLALRKLKAEHDAIWVGEVFRAFPGIEARVSQRRSDR